MSPGNSISQASTPAAQRAQQHALREIVRLILGNPRIHQWQLMGPGVLSLSLAGDTHVCLWGTRITHDGRWMIHLESPLHVECTVVAGKLHWHRYYPLSGLSVTPPPGTQRYRVGQFAPRDQVLEDPSTLTRYHQGTELQQEGETVIHRSAVSAAFEADPGTVAIVRLQGTPRLLWPSNFEMPSAFKRQATPDEVASITRLALALLKRAPRSFVDPTPGSD